MAEDIVREKCAGSGSKVGRFRRVHEIVAWLYPAGVRWRDVYNLVPTTRDARSRTVRRNALTPRGA